MVTASAAVLGRRRATRCAAPLQTLTRSTQEGCSAARARPAVATNRLSHRERRLERAEEPAAGKKSSRTVEALNLQLLEFGARLKLERLQVGPSELDGRTLRHRRCALHESPQPPDGRRRAEPRPELCRQPTNYQSQPQSQTQLQLQLQPGEGQAAAAPNVGGPARRRLGRGERRGASKARWYGRRQAGRTATAPHHISKPHTTPPHHTMAWPLPIAPCAIIQSLPIAPCATTLPQPVAPCAIIPPAHVAPCATALPSPIALCATAPPLPIAPCATDPPPPMAAALPPPPPQHHHTHTVLPPPPPLPTLHNGGMDVAGGGGADEGSSAARAGQGAAVGEAGRQGGGDGGIPIAHRAEEHATCRRCRTRFTLVNYNGPDPTCFPCRQAAGKGAAAQRRMHREHRQAGCPPPIRVGDRATASAQVAAGATVAGGPKQGKVSNQPTAPTQAKKK